MHSEMETRILIAKHREFLGSIVDPIIHKCEEARINGMELILDD